MCVRTGTETGTAAGSRRERRTYFEHAPTPGRPDRRVAVNEVRTHEFTHGATVTHLADERTPSVTPAPA